jgi:hypothetical protein
LEASEELNEYESAVLRIAHHYGVEMGTDEAVRNVEEKERKQTIETMLWLAGPEGDGGDLEIDMSKGGSDVK